MQASKTRSGSSDMPQKTSPRTPQATRQPKLVRSGPDSTTSTPPATRAPTERNPKPVERKSPRSPASDSSKKRVSRVSELESQLIQAQEDLKKTKELLSSSESCKTRALEEADEAKKQYLAIATDFEGTKRQLLELSASENATVQELQKLSQEHDKAWQSELEALQKQNSSDSGALASAMNEIQKLKLQIEMAVDSEAVQARQAELAHKELQMVKQDMLDTISLVGILKADLNEYEKSETEYQELLSETQMQLEVANATMETLRSDGLELTESFNTVCVEFESSKSQVNILKESISAVRSEVEQLKSELEASQISLKEEKTKSMAQNQTTDDIASGFQSEVEQLKSALEAAETRLQEEQGKGEMGNCFAYELADHTKIESCLSEAEEESALKEANTVIAELKANLTDKEAEWHGILDLNKRLKEEIENLRSTPMESELEAKLKMSMEEVEELKSNLMDKETKLKADLIDKETELHRIANLNERLKEEIEKLRANPTESELESKLKMSMAQVADLKGNLMDKETELQNISEENKMLKVEIQKREEEMCKVSESAVAELEVARAAQQDVVIRLGHATEEADKNSRRAASMAEQLEAVQATNSEMEAELRRLRIQSEQWRKAAEAAAAILNNGKMMERTGSMDSEYLHFGGKLLSSPYSDDMDEESPKKKKNNMLKKLGVLWKKGQK